MCGIVGVYNYLSQEPVAEGTIQAMLSRVKYRGPDDHGVFVDGALGLGHRRLSILDTSPAGHQPMIAPSGLSVITYNGELYNYVELGKALEDGGQVFHSRSDTEVILAKYEAEGEGCLRDFIGMFAFGLWDQPRRRLILARDRVGIKPLYWTKTRGGIAFASEIKSLLALPDVKRQVAIPAIDPYLRLGLVPGQQTMFEGIYKLLPGHLMAVEDRCQQVTKYWDLTFDGPMPGSSDSRAEDLLALLSDSVRIHLRSDVPVGVFLSGGLDSSVIAALVRQQNRADLKTFSVAFDMGDSYDERPYARIVAKAFQTDHHEVVVTPREFQDLIPRFVWHMDEPIPEAAAIPLYRVAELAAKHVTVVLSGEGSDELFGGYDIYRYMQILETLHSVVRPKSLQLMAALARTLGAHKVGRYLDLGSLPLEHRYAGVSMSDFQNWSQLYAEGFCESLQGGLHDSLHEYYVSSRGGDYLSRMLYLDTKTWLPDDILIKADKMTMAHSLELRVPFLDHRVIEFAAKVPSREKSTWRSSKGILKKTMRGILPEPILTRKKMGFPTPIEIMFRGPLLPYVHEILNDRRTRDRGYFRSDFIDRLLAQLRSGHCVSYRLAWRLIVLEEWHRAFGLG
jgi:asparagine synthase (glutamine-hydrolysing)